MNGGIGTAPKFPQCGIFELLWRALKRTGRAPYREAVLRTLVHRALVVIFADDSLRDAADRMARNAVGRLPVVTRAAPRTAVGIVTRSDLLSAHVRRLDESLQQAPVRRRAS